MGQLKRPMLPKAAMRAPGTGCRQVPAASESTMAVSKVSTTKEAQRRMGAVRERREARLMRVVTPLTLLDAPTEELPGMGDREAAGRVFEGRNLRIYMNRMNRWREVAGPARRPALLAHVLVHEITHLPQGCDHHAESGGRKARWDDADFAAMEKAALAFTPGDLELIRFGSAKRAERLLE